MQRNTQLLWLSLKGSWNTVYSGTVMRFSSRSMEQFKGVCDRKNNIGLPCDALYHIEWFPTYLAVLGRGRSGR